jgi:micrococcal nuclease
MLRIAMILVFLLGMSAVYGEEQPVIIGQVEQVLTSNIFTVMTERGPIYVRLAGIDTPDYKQPYGPQAYTTLANLINGKVLVMRGMGTDPCGRLVAIAWLNDDRGVDISSRMLVEGAAWVYRRYVNDTYLIRLEDEAKAKKIGLWALPADQRIPPWEWRKTAELHGYTSPVRCAM